MTAVSASVLKGYFQETDAPTCAQFSDLIDSLFARGSAAGTAAGVGSLGAGAVGQEVFLAATTASAQTVIGGGVAGRTVFGAITTASAQAGMGGGAAGRTVFEAGTTASAINNLGLIATTAQMSAPTNTSSAFITPGLLSYHPLMPKAWVQFNGVGTVSIRESWNVASIGDLAQGNFRVNWGSAFSNTHYGLFVHTRQSPGQTNMFTCNQSSANAVATGDAQISVLSAAAVPQSQDSSAISVFAMSR